MTEHVFHAPFCADRAVQRTVTVVENVRVARDTFRLRFEAGDLARGVIPGQFYMLRPAGGNDPLIGRPLALYDVTPTSDGAEIDVVYLVKGKFTQRLAEQSAGYKLSVWGPLGNGFSPRPTKHLILVAGGIGQTPMLTLGRWFLGKQTFGEPAQLPPQSARVTLLYGARSADLLAGVEDFERAGLDVRIATDDGSRGHRGFVTQLLEQALDAEGSEPFTSVAGDRVRIACCGPEPMMEAVAKIATRRQAPCEISLETPMACGIGICFTCVAKIRDEQGWDYQRTCVEGPIFPAEKIEW